MSSSPATTTTSAPPNPPPPAPPLSQPPPSTGAAASMAEASDVAPLLSQQEISTAIRDLAIAVQGIRLYLIGTQGMTTPPLPPALNAYSAAPTFPPVQGVPAPPPASPPPPPWSSWQPAPSAGLLQSPLPLSIISGSGHTSAPGVPLLQQSAAFFPTGTLQQQQQLPPPPTPPLQLLSSPTLSLSFGGQLQQQQLLPVERRPWVLRRVVDGAASPAFERARQGRQSIGDGMAMLNVLLAQRKARGDGDDARRRRRDAGERRTRWGNATLWRVQGVVITPLACPGMVMGACCLANAVLARAWAVHRGDHGVQGQNCACNTFDEMAA
nr:uncharacterized protein LOC127303446 [Lolium perenne]